MFVFDSIIPTPQHYTYFAQIDWLEKKLYTSINSISKNLGTVFLPLAAKICHIVVDKNKIIMKSWNYKEL